MDRLGRQMARRAFVRETSLGTLRTRNSMARSWRDFVWRRPEVREQTGDKQGGPMCRVVESTSVDWPSRSGNLWTSVRGGGGRKDGQSVDQVRHQKVDSVWPSKKLEWVTGGPQRPRDEEVQDSQSAAATKAERHRRECGGSEGVLRRKDDRQEGPVSGLAGTASRQSGRRRR